MPTTPSPRTPSAPSPVPTRAPDPLELSLAGLDALTGPADVLVVGLVAAGSVTGGSVTGGSVAGGPATNPPAGTRRGRRSRTPDAPATDPAAPRLAPGAETLDALWSRAGWPGGLAGALAVVGATGKAGELTRLPVAAGSGTGARQVLAVGLGPVSDAGVDPGVLRRAAGTASAALTGTVATGRAVVALPTRDLRALEAVAEGTALGAYAFGAYRTTSAAGPQPRVPLRSAVIASGLTGAEAAGAVTRSATVAAAVHRARDWVNIPAADLYPEAFVELAQAAVAGFTGATARALGVEVLDERALEAGGYGGLLGVGRGSDRPPRLLRIAYRPAKARGHLALVGKGITFDSGGYSIKPATGMITMKCDMAGAAGVVNAVLAAAALGVRTDITVYAALAENMVSGSATRPGDVVAVYGGTTVEITNTDAEGRMVMADALARSAEDGPDVVVDMATLTGACVVALGGRTAGVMGEEELTERVVAAGRDAGEPFWPLPIPEEMVGKLTSKVADLNNVGDREGGALQAAAFLRCFVADGIRWAHLDIAGPAYNEKGAFGFTPEGGTGFGVRTLVGLAELSAAGEL